MDQAVWSEDGTEIAYVVLHFEEAPAAPGSGTTRKRNFQHEVRAQRPDGSGDRQITAPRPGQNGAEVYYMRCKGYVLVPVVSPAEMHIEKHDLQTGQVTEVAREATSGCRSLWVVPSPDGAVLAKVMAQSTCAGGPPQPGQPPAGTDVEVTFLDAQTLQPLWNQSLLGVQAGWGFGWSEVDVFRIDEGAGASAWDLNPVAQTIAQIGGGNACLDPATTSSFIAADGRTVEATGTKVEVRPSGQAFQGSQPWGCGRHAQLQIRCP